MRTTWERPRAALILGSAVLGCIILSSQAPWPAARDTYPDEPSATTDTSPASKELSPRAAPAGETPAFAARRGALRPASTATDGPTATESASTPSASAPILAAGRGNPYVNYRDGRPLPAVFSGSTGLESALSEPGTKGLALASADFDEDGMPDLVASYSTSGGGLLSLHFGNVDAVYPNAPEAKERKANGTFVDAPFLPDAKLFETPERPDFIGAGDFDADGHKDIVTASEGGTKHYQHRGSGDGTLQHLPEGYPLPGAVSAMAIGDVNRRDGMEDILVGVVTPGGPKLLVFEAAGAALEAAPEVIELPAPATSIAAGRLDAAFPIDIAVAAGRHLVTVTGRDRRLAWPEKLRTGVAPAASAAHELPFAAVALTLGDYDADRSIEIAILSDDGGLRIATLEGLESFAQDPPDPIETIAPSGALAARLMTARVSSLPGEDILILDPAGGSIRIVSRVAPAASASTSASPQSTSEDRSKRPRSIREAVSRESSTTAVTGVPWITRLETFDGGASALPIRLNPDALADLAFLLEGIPSLTILETFPLTTFMVTSTNDSGPGSLREAMLQAQSSPGADAIHFQIPGAGSHTISPISPLPQILEAVSIDATTQSGYAGSPLVRIDAALLTASSTLALAAPAIVVRGFSLTGNTDRSGIFIDSAPPAGFCKIEANYIGLDTTGSIAANNNGIIAAGAAACVIGGSAAAARNVISGNAFYGITITTPGGPEIKGNYIGLAPSGAAAAPNVRYGVLANAGATVGGTSAGDRNVISGNGFNGIQSQTTDVLIQGNYIGTDTTGSSAVPNDGGVNCIEEGNLIGGASTAARNLISGNRFEGIRLRGDDGHTVLSNYIGTTASGEMALGNGHHGVVIDESSGNLIGGTSPSTGNLISSNARNGVRIQFVPLGSATVNLVQSNLIGTNASGDAPLGNLESGVHILDAPYNMIGDVFAPNVISANTNGVRIDGARSYGNVVLGNLIGLDLSGTAPLGNLGSGVLIVDAFFNTIGSAGVPNVIADNTYGVRIEGASEGNVVVGNRIGCDTSGSLAIQNALDGVAIVEALRNQIEGNQIAANLQYGISITGAGAEENTVVANSVGLDISGTALLTAGSGIYIEGASRNTVGGSLLLSGNVVATRGNNLLLIDGASMNRIEGNFFGTDATGSVGLENIGSNVAIAEAHNNLIVDNVIAAGSTSGVRLRGMGNILQENKIGIGFSGNPLGNGTHGIRVELASSGNVIGGAPGAGNFIANNGQEGVLVESGTATTITDNMIHDNGNLGIDLAPAGVTPNDPLDADTGPNGLQNFPVVSSVSTTGGSVTVGGTLHSSPAAKYTIDLYEAAPCDPSGHGEGNTPLGETTVVTDGSGDSTFNVTLPAIVGAGSAITATATDPTGNTSEFSACTAASGVPPPAPTAVEFGSQVDLSWESVPGATSYHLYGGTDVTLPALGGPLADACEAVVWPSPGLQLPPASDPPPGHLLWLLVTSEGLYGEGLPLSGGGTGFSSEGPCGDSCAHDRCSTGGPLAPACDPCASIVCEDDPACCTLAWDSTCVEKVRTVCRSLNCEESMGMCAHELCAPGQPLQAGCDAPPLPVSCTEAVCQVAPNCCTQAWDDTCLGLVSSVCGYNCL